MTHKPVEVVAKVAAAPEEAAAPEAAGKAVRATLKEAAARVVWANTAVAAAALGEAGAAPVQELATLPGGAAMT